MSKYADIEKQLVETLGLQRRPVAVSFLQHPPAGVVKFDASVPSGCSFWRLAAAGQTFYTVPADHFNCPIGSYTHTIDLPAERQSELTGTLALMTRLGYVRMEEVPGIPRLAETPPVTVYSPLADAPVAPDVVLVSGRPSGLMLLVEAAMRAGVYANMPLLGRPTCMSIPAALKSGVVTSLGCIGNRVYTGVNDDDLYAAIRGTDLPALAKHLGTIVSANTELEKYHQGRRAELATV